MKTNVFNTYISFQDEKNKTKAFLSRPDNNGMATLNIIPPYGRLAKIADKLDECKDIYVTEIHDTPDYGHVIFHVEGSIQSVYENLIIVIPDIIEAP